MKKQCIFGQIFFMQSTFFNFINKHQLQQKAILVAVSGGVDSMVLAQLCLHANLNFALAHCNFQLRGEESNADEALVKHWAEMHNIQCFSTKMSTQVYAKENQLSTQLAAREMRYTWFQELLEEHDFEVIFTAHHADDDVETFLIHLIRGTGLKGFLGIPEKNENILRPLLSFAKNDLITYAKVHKIPWREDASNSTDAYLRNRIRHQIIPILKQENANFLNSFQQTQQHLSDAHYLLEEYTHLLFQKIVEKQANAYVFKIREIKKFERPKAVLYQLLQDFGFTAWTDILELLDAENGKKVPAPNYWLTKDRDFLVLTEKNQCLEENEEIQIQNSQEFVNFGNFNLTVSKTDRIQEKSQQYAYFLESDLVFPLRLRKCKATDIFIPFGRNSKKKVVDFLKEEKIPKHLRSEVWVLINKNDIIWVVGYRTSQKYKIKTEGKPCIQFKLSSNTSY